MFSALMESRRVRKRGRTSPNGNSSTSPEQEDRQAMAQGDGQSVAQPSRRRPGRRPGCEFWRLRICLAFHPLAHMVGGRYDIRTASSVLGGCTYLRSVAQIVNLLYRRSAIGSALVGVRRSGLGAVLQDGILRYSRLAVCATVPPRR